jgi:hypothetical protein
LVPNAMFRGRIWGKVINSWGLLSNQKINPLIDP